MHRGRARRRGRGRFQNPEFGLIVIVSRTRLRSIASDEISGIQQSTSCQATIGVVPTGRAGRHFATASTGYHKLALSASSSVAGARPLCRLNAKRQISAHNAGNAIPTAAADFGSKLRAVIPGNVFASRHQN